MNRVFQVVWSKETGAWVVVSELATRQTRGPSASRRVGARRRAMPIAAALIALLGPLSANAQSLHWDGADSDANANGGNGTWQAGAANWDSAASGGANTAWSNLLPNDAIFGGVAGTVTIAPAGVTAGTLTFNTTGYTLGGGTLTFGGGIASTGNATINAVLAGTNGLVKTGAGTVFLSGANTYTGITQVQQGRLRLLNAQALGTAGNAASNLVVSNGAGLEFNATTANNLTATGGTITLLATAAGSTWTGAPTLTASTIASIGGGLSVNGDLADTGPNVLSTIVANAATFRGTNTYSGSTTLQSGVLTFATAGAMSPNSNFVIAGTPATQWSAVFGLTPSSGDMLRPLGTGPNQVRWTGSGGFTNAGPAAQVVDLGGAGATLTWGAPNFVATGQQLMLGTATNGGMLDFRNALALPTAGTNYDLAVYNGSATGGRAKVSGIVSGAGNLRIGGNVILSANGLLELGAANTYTGALILAGQGNYANVLLGNANAASPLGGITFAGQATATGSTLSLTASSGDFTRAPGAGAGQVQWTGNGGFSATGANRFVNLGGASATMTWGAGGFVPTGNWLTLAANAAGDAEIDFRNPIALGAAVRTINIGTGGTARLSGTLSGAGGGVQYQGGGQVTVAGTNTYTGTTTIGSTTNVVASVIGNGGVAGTLGASSAAAANLVVNNGTLTYVGGGETSDRNITVGTTGATIAANGSGALQVAGATAGAGAHALTLRGTSATSAINQMAGPIGVTGGGTLSVTKADANTWRLSNAANTYNGFTSFAAGVLEVVDLQDGGIASSIGNSSNAAANLRASGGTLRYIGSGGSTDRAIQLVANSTIESSGSGAIAFTSTGSMATSTGNLLTFGGTNGGANLFAASLTDMPTANNENQFSMSLDKVGAGAWMLTAATPGYTGNTTINAGALVAGSAGAITGGFGLNSTAGAHATYVVATPMSSLVVLNGGVLGLTGASGDFSRGLTLAARSFDNAGTGGAGQRADDKFIQGVRWQGSGGFAAFGGTRTVDLGGAGATVTWNTGGFVGTGQSLMLSYASADGMLAFLNPIALAGQMRTVDVADGSAAIDGELRGAVSGAGTSGLLKAGTGTLALTATNTYFGTTRVDAGTLRIGAGGGTGTLGTGAATVAAGATLAFDRDNAYAVSQSITGAGTLAQVGSGTTTLTATTNAVGTASVTRGVLDVDGTLRADAVSMGHATLDIDGTVQSNAGGAALLSDVGGADSTLRIGAAGTLRASGTLGDGSDSAIIAGLWNMPGGIDFGAGVDTMSVTGRLSGAGVVAFGAGDDTLELFDGNDLSGFVGVFDGGTNDSVDTLRLDIAGAFTLAPGRATGFEALKKDNVGIATLQGANTFASVTIGGGTLAAEGALTTQSIVLGDGATFSANGLAEATGGLPVALAGSAGVNTVNVGQGATLRATGDLGGSDDVLDVAGTLDIGGGMFTLGAGNDTFRSHDTTQVFGDLDGGVGDDALDIDVGAGFTVRFGGLGGFESLGKSGEGTMQVHDAATFDSVAVDAGLLSVVAGGGVIARDTRVASGATLSLGGTYAGTGLADTFEVAGRVSGPNQVQLGNGDDTVVLRDGFLLEATVDGGAHVAGDRLVADLSGNATLDSVHTANFETLDKQGAGAVQLQGVHALAGGTRVLGGTLDVAGDLVTPTLAMADDTTLAITGRVHAGGATVVTGSAGSNTVLVGAGATLTATGDLGDGDDVLDLFGTLDALAGTFSLGAGDDVFLTHATTDVHGNLDAGAGSDLLDVDIGAGDDVTFDGLAGFESLGKSGAGRMEIGGTAVFDDIRLNGGTLDVLASADVTLHDLFVASGTTLTLDGVLAGTGGDDTTDIAGVIAGGGLIDLGDGNDTLQVRDGAHLGGLAGQVDGGTGTNAVTADIAGDATLGGFVRFQSLTKSNVGTVHADGPALSAFSTVDVVAGTLSVGADGVLSGPGGGAAMTTTIAEGATLSVAGSYGCNDGNDTMDVAGTVNGAGTIGLCAGDDTLVLHDATQLNAIVDGGANTAAGDRVVLDLAATRSLDDTLIENFEALDKLGSGTLRMEGALAFDAGTRLLAGTLEVVGDLDTPTLSMADDATLSIRGNLGSVSGATAIAGSTGANAILVAAGATLAATGDLGDGDDVLDLAGALDTLGGTFSLGAGDDVFRTHGSTRMQGDLDAGAGNDLLDVDVDAGDDLAFDDVAGFESLGKSGAGAMEIAGAASFDSMLVNGGTLAVLGGADVSAHALFVAGGAR
jgi:fibronectin-binding autotransporter adhesin